MTFTNEYYFIAQQIKNAVVINARPDFAYTSILNVILTHARGKGYNFTTKYNLEKYQVYLMFTGKDEAFHFLALLKKLNIQGQNGEKVVIEIKHEEEDINRKYKNKKNQYQNQSERGYYTYGDQFFGDDFNGSRRNSSHSRSNPNPFSKIANSPYETLFLMVEAPSEVIKAAYKALSLLYHPDRGGDIKKMQELNNSYNQIKKQKGIK